MIEFLAFLLIAAPVLNSYFVWHGWHVYRSDPARSRILRALFVLKLTVWLIALWCAVFGARYLLGLNPFPFNGISLAVILIVINLIPLYVHFVVRQYEKR